MLKKNIGKLKRKMIVTRTLIWLNWSVATTNTTFQLLDIYRFVFLVSSSNSPVLNHLRIVGTMINEMLINQRIRSR